MSHRHFFIAGAQRSGTTYLYRLLEQHPDIALAAPPRPEPKFFLKPGAVGEGLDVYLEFFRDAKPGAKLGEKSTTYMERPDAARRICELIPDARLIFLLRDPVDRAVSNYWFSVDAGVESASMPEALSDDCRGDAPYDTSRYSTSPFAYLRRGRYRELLAGWEDTFSRDHLAVLLFEDLRDDPRDVSAKLFRFLGVDASFRPALPAGRVNPSSRRDEPDDELLERLAAYYEAPNDELASSYGLDLSRWRRPRRATRTRHPLRGEPQRATAAYITSQVRPAAVVPLHSPSIGGNERDYVSRALSGAKLAGDGPFTLECQRLLETDVGCSRALLTTSCTHALEMAALLLDLGSGDEVIVPAFAFVTTASAFVLRGARPIFVDVRPDTLNLDESRVEAAITPRTRAIVPIHYGGIGCEMDRLLAVADRHGISLVEDNAHGLFGAYGGRPLGSLGRLAALSFHETKNFTCGEGGALLVNDPSLVPRAEILREKGTDRSRFFRGEVDKYTWVDVGSSYLPADLLAALLLAQLHRRDEIQAARQRAWRRYCSDLGGWCAATGFRLPVVPAGCDPAYHCFYLLAPDGALRDAFLRHMRAAGIEASFHYLPLHLSAVGRRFGGREGDHPVCESAARCLLRLPLHDRLEHGDQDRVIEATLAFRP